MGTVEAGLRSQIRNIETRYGRTMAEWTESIRASGKGRHGEILAMLKADHGVTHGDANRIALEALEAIRGGTPADDPVDELYAGKRAGLRPIHERLMATVDGFGRDVEVSPKKGYVSLRRQKQFAMIQPAAARVDLGLILPGAETTERLEPAGTFNAMFTHRVRVAAPEEVDAELSGWLRQAYDAAGR